MNITVKNEFRVEAEVSADEMEQLGISFRELDYSSVDTRRFLWSVIEEIRGAGIDVDMSGRVLIEAYEPSNGGCVIAVTVLPQKPSGFAGVKQLVKGTGDCAFVSSSELSELISLSGMTGDIRSELFSLDGLFCLFLFPEKGNEQNRLSALLPEFYGVCSGKASLMLAECRERGKLLRKDDAVHMLSLLAM